MTALPVALSTGTRVYFLCNSIKACFNAKSVQILLRDAFCNTSILLTNSVQILSLQSISFAVGKAFGSHHVELQTSMPFKVFFSTSWKLIKFFFLKLGP